MGSDVAVNLNGGGGDDEGICILMRGSGRESGCRFRGSGLKWARDALQFQMVVIIVRCAESGLPKFNYYSKRERPAKEIFISVYAFRLPLRKREDLPSIPSNPFMSMG